MTIILDGSKSLWSNIRQYLDFIDKHQDEIIAHTQEGDENSSLLIDAMIAFGKRDTLRVRLVLAVVTERYIHDFHPDIATIKGGYRKTLND